LFISIHLGREAYFVFFCDLGYNTVAAREFCYPPNMLIFYPKWFSNNIMIPHQNRKVEKFSNQILKGTAKWGEVKPIWMSKIWEKERFSAIHRIEEILIKK